MKDKRQAEGNFKKLMIELLISIILPTIILKKLSSDDMLGPTFALIVALSLPLVYGLWQFGRERKFGFVPILGFVSILLTGGIGILQLDAKYIAIKEALIPLIIGIATLVSIKTPYPLVKTFIYNDMVLDTQKIDTALQQHNASKAFETTLLQATIMLASSFLLSSILNYILAKVIVTAASGSAEFNDQLGTMNMLSYPVIVLPCMLIMMATLVFLFARIKKITGLSFEEVMREPN